MEKIKQNKIWITIVVIGIIVIGILLAMLHQQKQNSPEAQSSSYASSVKASSASTSVKDQNTEKAYAKKAAKMKGHVIVLGSGKNDVYFTKWTFSDFKTYANQWAEKYSQMTQKQKYAASISFGTPDSIKNSDYDTEALDTIYDAVKAGKYKELGCYYDTVKDFNKDNTMFNPDDIQ
ncbi:hypothetical protein JNUCC76_06715 [Leuconostoc sp. JNUCC 76]